jgi:hypothetical protein
MRTLFRRAAAPAIGTMLAGLALLLGAAPSVHASSGGETISVAVPGRVSCADSSGTALGTNPTLAIGESITCTLAGFGAGEKVDVTFAATPLATVTMDGNGGGTYDFTVPNGVSAGPQTLTFTGETSKAVATFGFTVGAATPTTTPTSEAGGGSSGGGSGGGLAFTGADVLVPAGAALLLIGAGVGLTLAGRRRRSHG